MTALRVHGVAWALLVVAGFFALAASPAGIEAFDGWSIAFVLCVSIGAAMGLRKWEGLRWIAASFPFWAMSGAAPWPEFVALGLVFLGMAIGAVGPTLPGRRRRRAGAPLPHMADGPLVPVAGRAWPNAHPSRVIQAGAIAFGLLAASLAIVAATGWNAATTGPLALSSLIIAVTLAFSNWFAGRVQLRLDEEGLHSRLFFREHTIPWNEVAGLQLRYVFLPGVGGRIVYYCVRSPTREFAFPSSMRDARELQAAIEAATGLSWPVPDITPTL